MKKILFYILGAVLFTACSQDEQFEENTDNQAKKEIAFGLKVNNGKEIGTRAGGTKEFPYIAKDTKADMRIILEVYQAGSEKPIVRAINNDATEDVYDSAIGFEFPGVRLLPGNEYTAVFWADFGDDFYNADDLRNIEQKPLTANLTEDMMSSTTTENIVDVMDAYTGQVKFTMDADGKVTVIDGTEVTDPANIPVTLTRPLSKVCFTNMNLMSEVIMEDGVEDITSWDYYCYLPDFALLKEQALPVQILYKEDIYTTYDAFKKEIVKTGAKRSTSPLYVMKDFSNVFGGVYYDNYVYSPTVCDYIFIDGTTTNTKLSIYTKVVWPEIMMGADAFEYEGNWWEYMKSFKNQNATKFYGAGNDVDGGTVPFIINLTTAPNKLYRVYSSEITEGGETPAPLYLYEVRTPSNIPVISGTPGTPTELG